MRKRNKIIFTILFALIFLELFTVGIWVSKRSSADSTRADKNNNPIGLEDFPPQESLFSNLGNIKIENSESGAEKENNDETNSREKEEYIEILGTGQTNFAGSSSARIANIKIGSSKIDGISISAGEEFSFLKTAGKVTASEGYLPEANIRGGKTVMALGGGLCQVSTTLFRAALNAGLKITQRINHSYPVGYYSPQGTDAAIAHPSIDLKFINDTKNSIIIEKNIENFELKFNIYGISDLREIKISGPFILEKKENGHFKTALYQEIYKDEEIIRKDSFYSYYRTKEEFPKEY